MTSKRLCAAALAILSVTAVPAAADEVAWSRGIVEILVDQPPPRHIVVCTLAGATGMPEPGMSSDQFAAAMRAKPRRGYCLNMFPPNQLVRVDPDWPFNTGGLQNKIGFRCGIESDGYHFSCDWPPYAGPVTLQQRQDFGEELLFHACNGDMGPQLQESCRKEHPGY